MSGLKSKMFSELGAAALYNNHSEIPDLLASCDVNSRAFFFNSQIGWYFDDVPTLTLALMGDALEVINELLKVTISLSMSRFRTLRHFYSAWSTLIGRGMSRLGSH